MMLGKAKVNFGSVRLWMFCAAVLGMGLIASAYLNYVQFQRDQANAQQANGTITDLRYQLGLNKKPSASPSPSALPTATPTPTASPAVLGDQATPASTPAAATATVINGGVKLRSQPGATGSYTWLPNGSIVSLGSYHQNGWQQVTFNGQSGYVSTAYLKY